jgi:acylglycerol lipase
MLSCIVRYVWLILKFFLGPLLRLMSASHDLPHAKRSRPPPDPTLFPNYIQNKQGIWLVWKEWTPKNRKTLGVVFIVSGLAEHAGRYDSTALSLLQAGYHCFSMDHQGQGGSEGNRTYVERFSDYVDDQQLFVNRMLTQNPDLSHLPRFILGHSMGGLITVHTAARDPSFWNGVILSGPALQGDPKVATPFLKSVASLLSSILPKMPVSTLERHLISKNKAVLELANQDPYYHKGPVSARWAFEMLCAMDEAWSSVAASTYPFLIVHATDDKLCSVEGSRKFFAMSPSKDKRLREYDNMYHEVLTEGQRHLVVNEVIQFINERCSGRAV